VKGRARFGHAKPRPRRHAATVAVALVAAAAICIAGGCSKPLPEPGSASTELYAVRCGSCHPPHHPSLMTAAMWELMVDRMTKEIARRGMPALSDSERTEILTYLRRNAGVAP
jgi:hypothetical protein